MLESVLCWPDELGGKFPPKTIKTLYSFQYFWRLLRVHTHTHTHTDSNTFFSFVRRAALRYTVPIWWCHFWMKDQGGARAYIEHTAQFSKHSFIRDRKKSIRRCKIFLRWQILIELSIAFYSAVYPRWEETAAGPLSHGLSGLPLACSHNPTHFTHPPL